MGVQEYFLPRGVGYPSYAIASGGWGFYPQTSGGFALGHPCWIFNPPHQNMPKTQGRRQRKMSGETKRKNLRETIGYSLISLVRDIRSAVYFFLRRMPGALPL